MSSEDRKLAEAAASLTVQDFRYLQEHGMISTGQPDPVKARTQGAGSLHPGSQASPSPAAAGSQTPARRPAQRGRRQRVSHEWPEVGTILQADYFGQYYEAEVISAPQYRSGKAVKILTGHAAGQVCRSPSGAMVDATQKQRDERGLGKKGIANGWAFWKARN